MTGPRRTEQRVTRRLGDAGFSLVEMLIVLVVMAILLGIAVPTYLNFTDRTHIAVAQANVRAIAPSIERFYSDNETYVGLDNGANGTPPGLVSYDPTTMSKVTISGSPAPTQRNYCVYSTGAGATYFKRGPSGDITQDPGPNRTDCDPDT